MDNARLLLALTACWLLVADASSATCDGGGDDVASRAPLRDCITLTDVCIDQQHFITYDQRYQPWHSDEALPSLSIKDLTYNWPNPKGNGDRYTRGWNLHYAPVSIRPNSSEEACADTQQPAFDTCTVPLVLWARWPYNLAEAFATVYAKLWLAFKDGNLSPRMMPVLATPHGLRTPRHLTTFLGALFQQQLVSLAQLSARCDTCGCDDGSTQPILQQQGQQGLAASTKRAAGSAADAGNQVTGRCFSTAHLCKLRNRDITCLVSAAQHLQQHYAPQISEATQEEAARTTDGSTSATSGASASNRGGMGGGGWGGVGPDVLRVVFALRPGADSRTLLNEAELLAQCNAWTPDTPLHLAGGNTRAAADEAEYDSVAEAATVAAGGDQGEDLAGEDSSTADFGAEHNGKRHLEAGQRRDGGIPSLAQRQLQSAGVGRSAGLGAGKRLHAGGGRGAGSILSNGGHGHVGCLPEHRLVTTWYAVVHIARQLLCKALWGWQPGACSAQVWHATWRQGSRAGLQSLTPCRASNLAATSSSSAVQLGSEGTGRMGSTAEVHPSEQVGELAGDGVPDFSLQQRALLAVDGRGRAVHSARCVGRAFGSGGPAALLRDIGFMAHADVLVCLHGAACLNGFFMPNQSSLVEVRPLGMNKRWANDYFFKPLAWEKLVHWYGIDVHDPANSHPSFMEKHQSNLLNVQVQARERHVRLPWAALKHHLDLIAHVQGASERYKDAYRSGAMYINDQLKRLSVRPKLPQGADWG